MPLPRPTRRRRPATPSSSPSSGVDPAAALDRAIDAAETVLEEALPRLKRLSEQAEQTRIELEALLTSLRETAMSLKDEAEPEPIDEAPEVAPVAAPPLVAPPPRASRPPAVAPSPFPNPAIVPPPVPPEAMPLPARVSPTAETDAEMPSVPDPAARRTSPHDETSQGNEPIYDDSNAPREETIRFNCEKCGAKLSAPGKYAGKAAACKCGTRTTIPARSTREAGGF